MDWVPYEPNGVLILLGENSAARLRGILRDWETAPDPRVTELTPAYDKILVEFKPGTLMDPATREIAARFEAIAPIEAASEPARIIDVEYRGEDLAELCEAKGLTRGEFVAIHSGTIYEVAMLGFAPGFPYLTGLDPRLHTPRRATPRSRIPRGSVAIGGSHTGIYSIESPGGWNLIGHTEAALFNPDAEPVAMFLLRPGDRVKFEPR